VRRAIYLAMDRRAAVQVLLGGDGDEASFVPPGGFSMGTDALAQMPGYRQPKDADRTEAKRLLAEAGYAGGLKLQAVFPPELNPFNATAAPFIKDQLRTIDVDVELRSISYADLNVMRKDRSWQMWINTTTINGSDPFFLSAYVSKENLFGVDDARVFDLNERQNYEPDAARRKAAVRELEERMIDAAVYVPICFRPEYTAARPYVQGFSVPLARYNFAPQFERVWRA
jgi:ABC-type transport system substrate-binding protein